MIEVLSLYKGVIRGTLGRDAALSRVSRLNIPQSVRQAALETVAEKHSVSVQSILGTSRTRYHSHARHEVMWVLRSYTAVDGRPAYSFPDIARALNRTDHTTAIHGVRAHEERLRHQQPMESGVDDRLCRTVLASEAA